MAIIMCNTGAVVTELLKLQHNSITKNIFLHEITFSVIINGCNGIIIFPCFIKS